MDYDSSLAGLMRANEAYRDSVRENLGRVARCTATHTTIGIGEARMETAIAFNLLFTEEPTFTSGFALDDASDLVDGHFPRVSCGVYDWHTNNKGFFIGAWLFFTVDTIGPGAVLGNEPNYKIHHHLRWEGKAIKDVPGHLLDF